MAELVVKYFDLRRPGSYGGLDKFYRSDPRMSRKRLKTSERRGILYFTQASTLHIQTK